MVDKVEEKPTAAAATKPATAAKPAGDEKPAPTRTTKIVEQTGRYICKRPITFTDDRGRRAHAKGGDVVGIAPEDVPHLKKAGAIVEETREE